MNSKIAVISGASNGIGAAVAEKLVSKKYIVYNLDIRPCKNANIISIITDISDEISIMSALKNIPYIDVVVNNAGIMTRGTIFDSDPSDFESIFSINVKGSWLLLKYSIPKMKQGVVVQISSNHAIKKDSDPGLYTLTKMTVANMQELASKTIPHITFKTAFLGHVDTELGRYDLSEAQIVLKNKESSSKEKVAQVLFDLITQKHTKVTYVHPDFIFS